MENWTYQHKSAVFDAVVLVGQKFAAARKKFETASQAFRAVYKKGITFVWDSKCNGCRHGTKYKWKNGDWQDTNVECGDDYATRGCAPGGGLTTGTTTITFASMSAQATMNVVHELGHVYNNITGASSGSGITPFMDRSVLRANPVCATCYFWQQHPWAMDDLGYTSSETFADMFIAWVYDAWSTDPKVGAAQGWMDGLVP